MRGHELLIDAVAAFVLGGCSVVLGLIVWADGVYFLVSLSLLMPLVLRRRRPVLCAAVVSAVALVQWLTLRDSLGLLPADLAVPVVVYGVAAYGPPWAGRAGLALGLGGAGLGGLSWPMLPASVSAHVVMAAFLASTVVAAWAIGVLGRVRRRQVGMLAERARLLEVERDQRDRLAVMAERTRIAREMHDVVAHSLAVLIAQADGGRYATSPEAGRAALATIGDYGRQALAETRRVLGVLRDGSGAGGPAAPQPGVEDVPGLVERVRAGGLDVRLTLEEPGGPVEPGLALVVYRIVQEGLTNVIKHAGPDARAEVAVRWGARLEIDVLDDGRAPSAATSGGYGVLGMRERASAYGGTVTLEPRPGGGRVLSARIPMPS